MEFTLKSNGKEKDGGSGPGVVKRPDRTEHQRQVDAIMAEILALNEKAKMARAEQDKILSGQSGSKGEIEETKRKLKDLSTQKNQLINERNEITGRRDASRDKLNSLRNSEKAMRTDMKFSTVEAIDNQIRELERRQARTTMTLNDEKKIVKDIHNLQMSKKTVGALAELKASIEQENLIKSELDRRITEKNVELKLVTDRTTALRAVLDSLSNDPSDKVLIPNLKKVQNECREQNREKYQTIKSLKAEFKKQEEDWNTYQVELNQKRKEARQKEIEARQAEEEIRRKQLEAEELARVPYEDEMNLCENLIVYLRTFTNDKENGEAGGISAAASVATASSASDSAFKGMKILAREDEDYAVLGKGKGKGKKKGGSNSKKETIAHSMDTIASFSFLEISPPTNTNQVPAAIEALTQKKLSFQGIERGSVPTLAQAQARAAKQPHTTSASGGSKSSRQFSLESDFPSLSIGGAKPETEDGADSA